MVAVNPALSTPVETMVIAAPTHRGRRKSGRSFMRRVPPSALAAPHVGVVRQSCWYVNTGIHGACMRPPFVAGRPRRRADAGVTRWLQAEDDAQRSGVDAVGSPPKAFIDLVGPQHFMQPQ